MASVSLSPTPRLPGCAVALLAMAAAIANVVLLETTAPVASFLLAVMVSAWFAGTRAGMLAAVAAVLVLALLLRGEGGLSRLGYFVVTCAFVVWVVDSGRRASRSLQRARDELLLRNEVLARENLEARALEAQVRDSERRLRLVIDTIPVMAWIVLPSGELEFLNRRWLAYTGLELEDALVNGPGALHPDDLGRAIEGWDRSRPIGEPYEQELRLRRADGQYRWFLVRTVPLFDEHGAIVRWYGTSTDIEDRRRAEEALRESADHLQRLSRRLLEVHEEERRHFARELHDEFGQLLATVKLHLHAARGVAGSAAQGSLEECMSLLARAGDQVRSLALELRPTLLESAGLDGTLRWLAEQHAQSTGMRTRVVGQLDEVPNECAIACFRVAQQALTNVVQHARAQSVCIEMRQDEATLEIAVRDDGVGFDAANILEIAPGRGHLGLLGMRERVEILGGALAVDSTPGEGTCIAVRLPLPPIAGERAAS